MMIMLETKENSFSILSMQKYGNQHQLFACMQLFYVTFFFFPNCKNYGIQRSLNPNPTSDDAKLTDNALYQQVCACFKVDYLEEMDIIHQTKR